MFDMRPITGEDAPLLRELAKKCGPLEIHTPYTYWTICNYFGKGCRLLLNDRTPAGYIMTLSNEDTLFIWQIGILPEYRGKYLSQSLIMQAFAYARLCGKHRIEVTIDPNNQASNHAFQSFCDSYNYKLTPVGMIEAESSAHPGEMEYEMKFVIEI